MVSRGMDRVCISVSNLENSLTFYRDWVGMKVVAEQTLEPEEVQNLWNLPRGIKAKAAFLDDGEQSTLLELIEFTTVSRRTIRTRAKPWNYGLYDIAFLVNNATACYRDLTEKGFTFISPPVEYQPNWAPYAVKEAILIGPDNVPIAHIERMTSDEDKSRGKYIRLIDSAQIVKNMSDVVKFYGNILGLDLLDEMTIPQGLIDDVLGLPRGTKARMAFFNKKGAKALIVEFVQLSVKGKSLAQVARPPNLGLFMISFEVNSLLSLMERFKVEGLSIISGPAELHTKVHGKMRTITVEGPNGEMIELFER